MFNMIGSILFFIGLLGVCLLLSYRAEKANKIKPLFCVIILLSLVSGLRGTSVGIDTPGYINIFELIASGKSEYVYSIETTFKTICSIIAKVWDKPVALFLICSVITNALIVVRLWDFRDKASITWMVLIYYVMFYFSTMNIMRQMVAVAILFYGTRYIHRRSYLIYLSFVAVAYCFHRSALIGVGFIGIDVLMWKYLSQKQRAIICLSLIALPFVSYYIIGSFVRYSFYFKVVTVNIGLMLFAKLGLYLISLMDMRKERLKNDLTTSEIYELQTVKIYFFIGIVLTGVGYFFSFMGRVGLPFYIFECVYWGMLVKSAPNKVVYRIVIIFIMMYIFVGSLISDGQGVLPYTLSI